MRERFLPFSPPDVGEDEIAEVAEALRSGWITTGPRTREFEERFAAFVGADAALAVNSGTAALHLGLLAHGIGPGDGVVLPTMTFSSAAHVVEHVGAVPVLVDVHDDTLNIDVAQASATIDAFGGRVSCIAPTHLYGHPCDFDAVLAIATEGALVVVDDAAHALPARVMDKHVGGSGHPAVLTAFSFYATKNLTTGEGGMLTGPASLIDEARAWTLHGMTKDAWRRHEAGAAWRYDVDRAGFKYNMSDIAAAIGLVQLRRLPEMHERRRSIAASYTRALKDVDVICTPTARAGVGHAWHIYAIRVDIDALTIDRDRFIAELTARNIGTSVHFIPIHTLTYYANKYGYKPDDFPVAWREFQRLISLPIHTTMSDEDVDDVVEAVTDVARTFRR